MTKTHEKMQVLKATSSKMRLFTSLDIHYNNSPNTEVQEKNETKKETLKKGCWLDGFWDSLHCILSIDIKFF